MTKTGKIFLGCGGALVAGVVVVLIAGYFLMDPIGHRLNKYFEESSKPDKDAGATYGATVDQNGCIDEGLKRSYGIGILDLNKAISLGDFVRGCLPAAKPVKDFCTGTPGLVIKDTEWAADQCNLKDMDPTKTGCAHVFMAKNTFCNSPH